MARIANNDEHAASPKAANIKTQPSTPVKVVSWVTKYKQCNKLSTVIYVLPQIILIYVPLMAFSFHGLTALVGLGLLIFRASWLHLVGLLRTGDQSAAETCTWQYTALTRNRRPCPSGIWTHHPSRPATEDPRLRPRSQWDRHFWHLVNTKYISELSLTAPLCESSKCLFVSRERKSEFGVRKTDKGREFLTTQVWVVPKSNVRKTRTACRI